MFQLRSVSNLVRKSPVLPMLAATLTLVACGASSSTESSRNQANTTHGRLIELSGGRGLIVSAEHADEYGRDFFEVGEDPGFWEPSEAQVQALEAALAAHLASQAPAGSRLREGLEGYHRHFTGVQRNGELRILAAGFCGDWQAAPNLVDDGGDCYFEVEYRVEAEDFDRLYVHGEA